MVLSVVGDSREKGYGRGLPFHIGGCGRCVSQELKEKSRQEMHLSGARTLQAQRTAIKTTWPKISYYKFSYVLKLLESLVKRYTHIKHRPWITFAAIYIPITIYKDAPFTTNWSALYTINLFNFCQIDVLIFISLITGDDMQIFMFFGK